MLPRLNYRIQNQLLGERELTRMSNMLSMLLITLEYNTIKRLSITLNQVGGSHKLKIFANKVGGEIKILGHLYCWENINILICIVMQKVLIEYG